MKNTILTLFLVPLFLISCDGLKDLKDKFQDEKTPTNETTDSNPPAPPQIQWQVSDIYANWVSDCIEINNNGMNTIRYLMTFSSNNYNFSICDYPLAIDCQSNANGTRIADGSAPANFYPHELKTESASLGKDITTEDGSYFMGEINSISEAFFWGSPTSKNILFLQDIGNAGAYTAGVVDYDLINSQNLNFLSIDLTQTSQSDMTNNMVLFSRINGAMNLANYGCSVP